MLLSSMHVLYSNENLHRSPCCCNHLFNLSISNERRVKKNSGKIWGLKSNYLVKIKLLNYLVRIHCPTDWKTSGILYWSWRVVKMAANIFTNSFCIDMLKRSVKVTNRKKVETRIPPGSHFSIGLSLYFII